MPSCSSLSVAAVPVHAAAPRFAPSLRHPGPQGVASLAAHVEARVLPPPPPSLLGPRLCFCAASPLCPSPRLDFGMADSDVGSALHESALSGVPPRRASG
ncbi:unnamed protein product [Prorocentrum cordatum]|uniref:Uncharacterized protein n=1 Tax=Prorocentrum cordatum TaxID=2364126 RepID=A0ABN9PCI5_9DINO|nr:unnamed protein product [Polarella glacialis]